jgi:hypothetical protein
VSAKTAVANNFFDLQRVVDRCRIVPLFITEPLCLLGRGRWSSERQALLG